MEPFIEKFARRFANLEGEVRALATTPKLAHSSIEDGSIDSYDGAGTQTLQVGKQYDGTNTAASLTGPTPPTPSAPVVTDATEGVAVKWDGFFVDPLDVAPMDWSSVDVAVFNVSGFDAIATEPAFSFKSARGGEVFIPLAPGAWHCAFVTRSQSGKPSLPSVEMAGASLAGGATLKTAATGQRIEIGKDGVGASSLLFYSGAADETFPAQVIVTEDGYSILAPTFPARQSVFNVYADKYLFRGSFTTLDPAVELIVQADDIQLQGSGSWNAKMQAGTNSITPSAADTSTRKTITFPTAFPTGVIPAIQITVGVQPSATIKTDEWYEDVTNAGFVACIMRGNTTPVPFSWMAMAP